MIDYKLLHESIIYYENLGINRIEVPWMVTDYVDNLTKPEHSVSLAVSPKNKNLVASGEQSFLYLYLKEYLPKGKFQTVTPCFRNDTYDFTHSKQFIKNELIVTDDTSIDSLERLVEYASKFFSPYFPKNTIDIVSTPDGYDLEVGGIELGSYGVRECDFLKWIYGTGCAEPRTSKLIKKLNK